MEKTLDEIHEDVPADHYDRGVKYNLFQRFWHWRRFSEVKKISKEVKGPVLDIGCHSGLFTSVILPIVKTEKIYGIDVSANAIKKAKKRIPNGDFIVGDIHKLPYKDNFFDAVYCLEVLEHVDSPIEVLKEIKRVMNKGGYGVILVPNDRILFKLVWFLWTLYYPVWRHAHVQSFSGNELDRLIIKIGFKIINSNTFNFGMLKLVVFEK